MVKNLHANSGDVGLIPGSGRSPGGGLDNSKNVPAWKIPWTGEPGQATVPGVAKSRT